MDSEDDMDNEFNEEEDFDPDHLTPGQKACNEVVELLRNTDLYKGLYLK